MEIIQKHFTILYIQLNTIANIPSRKTKNKRYQEKYFYLSFIYLFFYWAFLARHNYKYGAPSMIGYFVSLSIVVYIQLYNEK